VHTTTQVFSTSVSTNVNFKLKTYFIKQSKIKRKKARASGYCYVPLLEVPRRLNSFELGDMQCMNNL